MLPASKVEISIYSLVLSLIILFVTVQGDIDSGLPLQNLNATTAASAGSSSSPWLKKTILNPRQQGCRFRPWICRRPGEYPARWRCCRNSCVDLSSDVNNCGLCGIRCPFTWQCCSGLCIDTNFSRFNCGRCGNRCPFRTLCLYGMCGYAQPSPSLPRPAFPFPPTPPQRSPSPPAPRPPCPPTTSTTPSPSSASP